jgi:hypothetical protein
VIASADGRVRRVGPDGTITSLPIRLRGAPHLAALADGSLVVTDPTSGHVFGLAPGSVAAETLATSDCAPALGTALRARPSLQYPVGATTTTTGALLVADPQAHRIVEIAAGHATVVAGAGLLAPARRCAAIGARPDPLEVLARQRTGPIGTDAGYPTGPPPPRCNDRYFWTFQLRYRFTVPRVPRVRQTFTMYYSSDRRVLVRLTTSGHGRARRFPSHSVLTAHAAFAIRVLHGLPRRGRYRTRLVAVAGGKQQCVDKTIRIRKRSRR